MSDPEVVLSGPLPEALLRELQELDLSPYEARVLLALLRLGSANSAQLARHSGVPRTSTYQIVEELTGKGLAQRLPVDGPATWATPGREEVFERLEDLMEDRLRRQKERTAKVRDLLASSFPEAPTAGAAYVHVLPAAQVGSVYARLLADTRSELLVFNRPPYSKVPEQLNPAVLDAIGRGIKAKALYETSHWNDPDAEAFREAMDHYHRGGVVGGLVDELPVKLAIADRRVALVAMTDPVLPEVGFPSTLLVEHPGFAGLQAEAFDRFWEKAHILAPPAKVSKIKTTTVHRPRGTKRATARDDGAAGSTPA